LLKEAKKLASFFRYDTTYLYALMNEDVHIRTYLDSPGHWQLIDVRSPGEFVAGHIPGAINLPLFNDEERARVGTLYKQNSPKAAMEAGLEIAGSKMKSIYEQGGRILKEQKKKLLIHCWRGGKRSQAVTWLMRFSGLEADRLAGGYKSYRIILHESFENNEFIFHILGGHTGTGKTAILKELASLGEQIIDLEQLARHKGSAFGSIGERPQPSTEQFENDLYEALRHLDTQRPVWMENESKNIGRVFLPEHFWMKMRQSILYNVHCERPVRLQRILREYSDPSNQPELKAGFAKIQKRLGGLEFQNAMKALETQDYASAADIALRYYDKAYEYQLSQWPEERRTDIVSKEHAADTASALNEHYRQHQDSRKRSKRVETVLNKTSG
jgi:tRNA 2-selenouridine synthase